MSEIYVTIKEIYDLQLYICNAFSNAVSGSRIFQLDYIGLVFD
jgi:hypothetical protein